MGASDSFWLIVWELLATVGVVVVIVGIIGEGSELLVKWAVKKKYKEFQKSLDDGFRWFLAVAMNFVRPRKLEVETFAFVLVVLGLMAEFWGGHKSQQILDANNSRLNMEAQQLSSTNVQLSLRIEKLRKANDELEAKTQPRIITVKQMEDFKAFMVLVTKRYPIKISIGQEGFDTETYAKQLRDMFTYAGFEPPPNSGPWGVFRDFTRIQARAIGDTNRSPFVEIIYNETNNFSTLQKGRFEVYKYKKTQVIGLGGTNLQLTFVTDDEPSKAVFEAINEGFQQIGIPVDWDQENDWVKPGEFELFVPIKNF